MPRTDTSPIMPARFRKKDSIASLSEAALVAVAKRGRTEAFELLCDRCAGKVLQATRRVTKNREDAEDALQDSFMRAFTHIKRFDGRSSFSTWLTRIAINSALMMLRKRRAARELSVEGPDNETAWNRKNYWEIASPAPNPEKRYMQMEREKFLHDAVGRLRPAIREMVEVQHFQEYSMKEAAKHIGISVSAAKGRMFHAKAALRKSRRLKAIGDASLRQSFLPANQRFTQIAS
ncbi:MAG TPA: sigma-70 family RNA polymerase sigma factor [Candidatus Dormibacteraeota bacterium]|nr:sigma-70 family RNA polymerase sigma factor [Candidatus Dormibacteraeota bacterium]